MTHCTRFVPMLSSWAADSNQQSEREHIEKRIFFCRREIDHFPQVKNLHISPCIYRIFISNKEERIKVFASSKQPPHRFKAFLTRTLLN